MKEIVHSKPWITDAENSAVSDLMATGMLAQGKKVREFECAMGGWIGARDGAVAVGSGSAAIVLALDALGVRGGDEVVLPSYICPKVFEAVATVGARPVLCDMGDYWIVRSHNVEPCITSRTKALIVPHLYGIFTDTESFHRLGVPIIEDFAQAMGPKGNRSLRSGDIAVFSFHPTKLLTTGEGGMAVSADQDLVRRMRAIRDGSENRDRGRLFSPMSDISGVLGLSQLNRYPTFLARRRAMAKRYTVALKDILPGGFDEYPFERSMFFRFPLRLEGGITKYRPLFAERGIRVSSGVDELLHRCMKLSDDQFRTSALLYERTVSLPIYPAMTESEQDRCVQAAVEIFSKYAIGQRLAHSAQ